MYGVGGSEAISRDMNSYLFSSTLKHSSEGEFTKNRDLMSSDLYHDHQQQQQQQQTSALMRNRSAPSSFFACLVDESGNGGEDYLNHQSSSPESETIFAGFVSGNGSGECVSRDVLQYPTAMKHETTESVPEQNDYSAASRIVYSTAPSRDMPNHNSLGNGPSMESSYSVMNSVATENLNQVKTNSGNCSNLIRQSSSPAGFLSHLTAENGFAAMRDVGNLRASNRIGVEASPSTSRLSNNMNYSSGPSTSRFIPQIAENGNGSVVRGSPENAHLGNSNDTNRCYVPIIPNDSWNNSTFNSLKRNRDGDLKMFSSSNGLDTQNGDTRHYTPGLVHHLSLPKTSAEMAAVEQYLQFQQDAVPCKIRAKRGFATHPRSIAERVRRTRISERMKKLQELFPNMDKQANTADMLDLAVDYIKDLQRDVQTLKETRARCTCSSKQKQSSPTA